MTNKIDISKLKVKAYKKNAYLIVKWLYKNEDNETNYLKTKFLANDNIKVNEILIDGLVIRGKEYENETNLKEFNLKLFKITINGYAVWLMQ